MDNLENPIKQVSQLKIGNELTKDQSIWLNIVTTNLLDKLFDSIIKTTPSSIETELLVKSNEINEYEQKKILFLHGYNYLSYCITNDISYFSELIRILNCLIVRIKPDDELIKIVLDKISEINNLLNTKWKA